MKKYRTVLFVLIPVVLLFAFIYYSNVKQENDRFDDALEGSNKGIAIMGERMMYLSFTEKEFLRTVRHGDIDSYLLSMRYGLSQTSNPRVWEDLENLGAYSDSVFHGFDANRIKNSDVSGRTKEKEAFLHLESIMKEFCSLDVKTCQPEAAIRRIEEMLEEWRENKKVLTDRMISSKKRFYLLNTGRYE